MMMNTSPNKNGILTSFHSHPRRTPAHRSVCLRHDSPPSDTRSFTARPSASQKSIFTKLRVTSTNESSDENDGGSSWHSVQKWFDRSNKHPVVAFSQGLEGDEPPYFLPHKTSNTLNESSESDAAYRYAEEQHTKCETLRPATHGSSVGDFRSVIDDLTIENRKLKEKVRKLQKSHNPHLEQDRLFEVKMHGLTGRSRRALEDLLRAFASNLDHSTDAGSAEAQSGRPDHTTLTPGQKLSSSSGTSSSRHADSAYASMSNSGPTSTTNLNRSSLAGKLGSQTKQGKEHNIQTFLHNIPQGLLPKQSPVMTERQKKKLVVQRLEQLFIGKLGVAGGAHSQPLQQQEVSRSAARADQAFADQNTPMEGIREAHMPPRLVNVDSRPGELSRQSSDDTQIFRELFDSSDGNPPDENAHEQRPTRPLDLDPDRAQVPSENIEYLRHLGQSTPPLITEDTADAAADAQGWIYLNLLVNMAQLHIVNVTIDFVRHAVQNDSEKLQLSRDGNKIRWRGGSQGTQLSSSDSGTSSALDLSPHDSDSLDDGGGKRRKIDSGRFASIPINSQASQIPSGISKQLQSFHYKPLFNHRGSYTRDAESSDESESRNGYGDEFDSKRGGPSRMPRTWSARSRPGSQGRRQRDDGPMVFYSGAKFCTDLSGDREILPPLHVTGVRADGSSDHTRDACCRSRTNMPPIFRTTSGSKLPFSPFKGHHSLKAESEGPQTPGFLAADSSDNGFFIRELPNTSGPPTPLQAFDASGLGGTQPADHFAVRVETRRTKTHVHEPAKLSRFSAPRAGLRKFYHTIPLSSLESFVQPQIQSNEETITNHLASLSTFSSSSPTSQQTASVKELPVRTEFLSAKFVPLEPSQLPDPLCYYGTSSEEDESECSDTSSDGTSHLRVRTFLGRSHTSMSDLELSGHMVEKEQYSSGVVDSSDDEDDDSDSSIDMLAHERELDPESVRRKEQEFEMAVNARLSEPAEKIGSYVRGK